MADQAASKCPECGKDLGLTIILRKKYNWTFRNRPAECEEHGIVQAELVVE